MIVRRGKSVYQYKSSRVNGEVKTIYERKVSSQDLKEHERRKEEKQQHRQREQELGRLNQELENVLKMIQITKRAYLLLGGFYQRKSEVRPLPLQEDYYAP